MCNKKLENPEIDLKVSDLVLTPTTCAVLINEILKYLIYQKSQIPYPYAWLKSVICRKRKSSELEETKRAVPSVTRNYNTASTAYDTIEEVTKNVTLQFQENGNNISELIILFGATTHCPKEVFKFVIPRLDYKHIDGNHVANNEKNKNKILRNLFFSENWIKAMEYQYPCTNMYFLINKKIPSKTEENVFFLPVRNYELNGSVRCTTVNFLYDRYEGSCCLDLQIYNDALHVESETYKIGKNSEGNSVVINNWYQAKSIFKGYKDCYVNKQSASDLF